MDDEDGVYQVECAYSPERMKPLPDKACDGRANPKGIPCLYLANRKDTAVSEVRPWIGSYVSVGQFKLLRNVDLIYCSRGYKDKDEHSAALLSFIVGEKTPTPEEIEKAVWSDIDDAFAEPMTRSDDSADYVATQILSELFKREGFGGVAYRSNFGENGHNIALFDIESAKLINGTLCKVTSVAVQFEQKDTYYIKNNHPNKKKRRNTDREA